MGQTSVFFGQACFYGLMMNCVVDLKLGTY